MMRQKCTEDTDIIPGKGKGKMGHPLMAMIALRPAGAIG